MSDPGYEARRRLLSQWAPNDHPPGADALHALIRGANPAEADALVRELARYDRIDGHGHLPDGFSGIKLARIALRYADRITPATREAVRGFLLRHDFSSPFQSENHALLFHAARCVVAQAWPDGHFEAYGAAGRAQAEADGAWLRRFLGYRARFGWGEFDSVCYLTISWQALCTLYDLTADERLRRLTGKAMDLLLADMAVDSRDGRYGGAHGRIYPIQALDHAAGPTLSLQYLYFGQGEDLVGPRAAHAVNLEALLSSYRPHPAVVALARERAFPYENRERKHLHNLADVLPVAPLAGSLRKYTYLTDGYILGCVQLQDRYPAETPHHPHGGRPVPEDQRQTAGYAHHQQHEWDLSFSTRPDARLFTHHPGEHGAHTHWTGDWGCGCGHFFQNRSALVALYDIPPGQACGFLHAYVPREAFDEVVEADGVIFVRAGAACAALRLSGGYRWTSEGEWSGREVVCDGPRHGIVCEAALLDEAGGFAAFRREIAANPVSFDPSRLELEYRSRRAGTLRIDARGGRFLDGRAADLDYPTYGSPYLRSEWGSGIAVLRGLTLDFRDDGGA